MRRDEECEWNRDPATPSVIRFLPHLDGQECLSCTRPWHLEFAKSGVFQHVSPVPKQGQKWLGGGGYCDPIRAIHPQSRVGPKRIRSISRRDEEAGSPGFATYLSKRRYRQHRRA